MKAGAALDLLEGDDADWRPGSDGDEGSTRVAKALATSVNMAS